jgi:hypothetical protein
MHDAGIGCKPGGHQSHPVTCHFENYLARRAAMPISPQRRTLGDLAVRRIVRVHRR